MRRDTSGRRRAGAVATPFEALSEPRCPHAPASTGLPYGLRYWITGGLGALGVGLALSLSAGTAAAAPAGGSEGGGAATSSTSASGSTSSTDTASDSAARPDRTSAATGRATPGRKGVRTVRTAGPPARATAEFSSDPIESDEESAPTAAPDTATDPSADSEKSSSATPSGRSGETGPSRPATAESARDEITRDDDETAAAVSAPSTRTVAAGMSTPAAAVTAAAAPAIPGSAALVNGRVVVGTIIVDILNGFGLPVPGQFARLVPINLPSKIEVWWFTARRSIYGSPGGSGPNDPGNPGELPLIWETNFDSVEEAERYWSYQVGRWGASAGDNQYYTDGANSYIDADGNLVIEARREATPDGAAAPYNYTSSRMVTLGKQSISVGNRVVARIKMPTDQGTVPAFWTLGIKPGDEYNFPSQGEIDIAEVAGHGTEESRRTWVGNLHGGAAWDENIEIKMQGIGADLGADLSDDFHEFGMDWHADRIVWHIDGVEVAQVTQQEWEAIGGDWTAFSGAYEHYLVLNIAVGNNWTGDPDPNKPFHSEMKVDWVKVYSLDTVTV